MRADVEARLRVGAVAEQGERAARIPRSGTIDTEHRSVRCRDSAARPWAADLGALVRTQQGTVEFTSVSRPAQLAEMVRYTGSGEHKRYPNPLANPALRSDASDCDTVDANLSQDPDRLQRLLREVFRRGQVDPREEGSFPRHAWGRLRIGDGSVQLFEVRLTNATQGTYKGYFIAEADLIGKRAWLRRQFADGGPWNEVLT